MNKSSIIFLYIFNITFICSINAQKEDYIWLIGRIPQYGYIDSVSGNTCFDFNFDPVKIYYDTIHGINMAGGNATISDEKGVLKAYSNCQILMNSNNEYVEDTINYSFDLPDLNCNEWESNTTVIEQQVITDGMLGEQRIIFIPFKTKYYAIYAAFNYCNYKTYKFLFTEFVLDNNNPQGKIIQKDIPFLYGDFIDNIQAVRHGNGRDWWIVFFSSGHEWIYTALLSENGIVKINKFPSGIDKMNESIGQLCISPDGRKLSFYFLFDYSENGGGFTLSDFNRCDGTISKTIFKFLPSEILFGDGVAFSHDSKYLYVANGNQIRQYNTDTSDILKSEYLVAETDGFGYYYPPFQLNYPVNFYSLKLGPDGRIYIFPVTALQRYISVIGYPYETHDKVNVKQHSIFTKEFTRTSPNSPEFRTGPLDNSPCDTLGLDNEPVAKFRYEADTLDHLLIKFTDLSYFRPESWRWDFGDGSPVVEEMYPTHRFAKNGSYNVCLTVSNENSSNTVCRNINISSTATDDPSEKNAIDISLYPNPVEDIMQVTLGEYIPEKGLIKIMDISGREIQSQRIYYGQNVVDMVKLQPGFYFCVFMDGLRMLKVIKVVKG